MIEIVTCSNESPYDPTKKGAYPIVDANLNEIPKRGELQNVWCSLARRDTLITRNSLNFFVCLKLCPTIGETIPITDILQNSTGQ